ncbi:hypothetical protein MICAE_2050007 [Microcystis aeruginosa PCC 9806]|uniref:Uncharacterized protein n=1 Tax=Microcystis aeruginosa PCC 9806 TaxID=1160282 RepID=I4GV14_MICAE|nr:hypothetical protein [Microcystis aeruginosa]CCI13638.1 hypothetical protein MICAE_2050007 [Microcystis aeruginosa PCC 9806]
MKIGKTLHPTPNTLHPTPYPHEKLFQQTLNIGESSWMVILTTVKTATATVKAMN